ncbi:ras-related protein Rab-39A [Pseudopipra pipra]
MTARWEGGPGGRLGRATAQRTPEAAGPGKPEQPERPGQPEKRRRGAAAGAGQRGAEGTAPAPPHPAQAAGGDHGAEPRERGGGTRDPAPARPPPRRARGPRPAPAGAAPQAPRTPRRRPPAAPMPGVGAIGARCRHRPRRSPRKSPKAEPGQAGAAMDAAIWIYQFRLIVLGDSTVGKSCLLHRFTEGRFPGPLHSDPTVGVDFFSRLVEIEPGKRVKLQLWDTAGQERFRSITRSYYRNSVGGLLVFDLTNRRSFEHVKDWLEEAKMHVQPFQIVFLLVGHKCDLVSQREVTREEAEKLSSDCGMKYIETSAKDATNVEESFTILTRDIYELVKNGEISIQDGWEGVKSGFVPNVVHSSEEAVKPRRQCIC